MTTLGATSNSLSVTSGVPQGSIFVFVSSVCQVSARCSYIKPDYRFCRWYKGFKEITSKHDAEQLQGDLSDLITWSDSAGLDFKYRKCKAQRITRKTQTRQFWLLYSRLSAWGCLGREGSWCLTSRDNLTWNMQVGEQCAKASRLQACARRIITLVKRFTVRRPAYLTLVRSHFGYATQVWTSKPKELIRKLERVQRRATKYILDLPFIWDQTSRNKLTKLNLLPISLLVPFVTSLS